MAVGKHLAAAAVIIITLVIVIINAAPIVKVAVVLVIFITRWMALMLPWMLLTLTRTSLPLLTSAPCRLRLALFLSATSKHG